MRLDRRFSGAAVLLSPQESENIADLDVGIDYAQGQRRALVVAVTTEHRIAHHLAAQQHAVIAGGGVVAVGEIEVLVAVAARFQQRGEYLEDILGVPRERDLLALGLLGLPLERFAADELMIESDERAVAERKGGEVVVFDVVRDKTAANRASTFIAARGQPLT